MEHRSSSLDKNSAADTASREPPRGEEYSYTWPTPGGLGLRFRAPDASGRFVVENISTTAPEGLQDVQGWVMTSVNGTGVLSLAKAEAPTTTTFAFSAHLYFYSMRLQVQKMVKEASRPLTLVFQSPGASKRAAEIVTLFLSSPPVSPHASYSCCGSCRLPCAPSPQPKDLWLRGGLRRRGPRGRERGAAPTTGKSRARRHRRRRDRTPPTAKRVVQRRSVGTPAVWSQIECPMEGWSPRCGAVGWW
jgi:hypothetical protein